MKLDELVNRYYEKLNENDLAIWQYISAHRRECEKLSIAELSKRCNVSQTTAMRFVQKISLKGYSELKVYLRMDNALSKENISNVDKVCYVYAELIKDMKDKDCTPIFELINQANRLYVYGAGMIQTTVQRELKRVFLTANKLIFDINGQNEAKKMAGLIKEEDLVIIISVSGESETVLDFAKTLKIRNIPFLSITKLNENTLARISNANLYISSQKFNEFYGSIDYETVTSYFMLIEVLFLKYVEYKKNQKGRN